MGASELSVLRVARRRVVVCSVPDTLTTVRSPSVMLGALRR